ncbi:NtaA/DmoA family FMN-dependent monooxygenase [Jiella avicenniae]|uniref:NtaA/DmoA family FMN-dependent monooxygenase n=1 Tax=Jiella avicenniae TaxID=2907202 RepID=A0A9X1P4P2_9HYPH|nr:NtaA/DmoA family FMN-dependent monooxygenase [Jiella avicenniae]MCE7029223.1 NtaA/DmoA family FMN-dependent monooxygenase [Jiella avicenniae]
MRTKTRFHIGLSLSPTWLGGDAWRRSDSAIEDMFESGFSIDVAKRAEAAKLDFVFRPDNLYLDRAALEKGPGFASLDPTILLASIARETSHIGLLTTASTTFYPPFLIARQLQSLNWLSRGRAGWNVVTSLDGNQNFGLDEMPSTDERYARASEAVTAVKSLWRSFPNEALEYDRASGRFADPERIEPINFEGSYYEIAGPLNTPEFAASRIPIVQAGASPTGRDFAASIADAVFASTPDKDAAIELRSDLKRRAEVHGRGADAVRVLPGLSLFLAESRAEAEDLFAETHARVDGVRKLASIREMTGLDLAEWPKERQIKASDLPPPSSTVRSRTHSDLLRRLIARDEPTLSDLLRRPEVIGSAHWRIVGTVTDAAAEIAEWADAGAIDGFVAVPGGSVGSMHLFLEGLVPRLAESGLFRRDYCGPHFADHLGL